MFKKLQQKWKVNGINLFLILCTFALGGSLCGFLGRKILGFTALEKGIIWFVVYIVLITILWPLTVIIVSVPLGQFAFFKKYLQKIFARFSGNKNSAS
jgi:hypothetical protein